MTLAELTQKIENALKDNTPFTEQVKVTLQVVAEQLNALKTLDGYYSQNLKEFTQMGAEYRLLVDKATDLLNKVEQSRAEAEAIVNARIDGLYTTVPYKSGVNVKVEQVVTYGGEFYTAKKAFTTTSWTVDKNNLVKASGSWGSGSSNAYAEGKVISKGELITYNEKSYIALENFTATNWTADQSKFVEYTPGSGSSNAYETGKVITKGEVLTHNNKLYIATESFTATNWESDESKFIEYGGASGDLSNYYDKDQIDLLLEGKCDLLTPGTGVEVTQQDGNIIVGVKDYDSIKSDIVEIAKTINTGLTTLGKHIFSLQVDFTKINSGDPSEYLKATDEASGASADEIRTWLGHYPCILSPEGVEFKKLKKDNYATFEDGGDASSYIITLGNDVVLARPLRGYRLRHLSANIGELSFTDDSKAQGFCFDAHRSGDTLKDVYYEGVYKGFVSGGKLYSTSNQYPSVNATLNTFRNYAKARGERYQLVDYSMLKFRQAAYLLVHQNLNSKQAIGTGWVNMSSSAKTGTTNAWGFNSELIKESNPTYLTDGKHQVKGEGLEDPWGNIWEFIDGFLKVDKRLLTGIGDYNDEAKGYRDCGGVYPYTTQEALITSVAWDNERGFYPTNVSGYAKDAGGKYFADGFWQTVGSNTILRSGGDWVDGACCGVFCLNAYYAASLANGNLGARLAIK